MFYPAPYAAMLYEPEVADGETLDAQYAKGKWHLPSCGTLCRIYNFYLNSCNRVTYANGGRINVSYADENPESEAKTPLFANLLKRIRAVTQTNPFVFQTNSSYWSSTECSQNYAWYVGFGNGSVSNYNKYNSLVVRPVAVFRFTL